MRGAALAPVVACLLLAGCGGTEKSFGDPIGGSAPSVVKPEAVVPDTALGQDPPPVARQSSPPGPSSPSADGAENRRERADGPAIADQGT